MALYQAGFSPLRKGSVAVEAGTMPGAPDLRIAVSSDTIAPGERGGK